MPGALTSSLRTRPARAASSYLRPVAAAAWPAITRFIVVIAGLRVLTSFDEQFSEAASAGIINEATGAWWWMAATAFVTGFFVTVIPPPDPRRLGWRSLMATGITLLLLAPLAMVVYAYSLEGYARFGLNPPWGIGELGIVDGKVPLLFLTALGGAMLGRSVGDEAR